MCFLKCCSVRFESQPRPSEWLCTSDFSSPCLFPHVQKGDSDTTQLPKGHEVQRSKDLPSIQHSDSAPPDVTTTELLAGNRPSLEVSLLSLGSRKALGERQFLFLPTSFSSTISTSLINPPSCSLALKITFRFSLTLRLLLPICCHLSEKHRKNSLREKKQKFLFYFLF